MTPYKCPTLSVVWEGPITTFKALQSVEMVKKQNGPQLFPTVNWEFSQSMAIKKSIFLH